MNLLRAALLTPLLFLQPTAGCGFFGCTLIGAEDGLRLEVDMAAPLPDDRYTFVVRAEGREVPVGIVFEAGGGECVAPCRHEVDLGEGRTLIVDPAIAREGGWLNIGIPGEGGPAFVELELRRGDATVVTTTYEPEYRTYRPNGRGCPPAVEQATGRFEIPAL